MSWVPVRFASNSTAVQADYVCLSSDSKVTVGIKTGEIAFETDTGDRFVYDGSLWVSYATSGGGGGGGGDASAANQTTGNTTLAAISTAVGAKTDAKSAATDGTSASAMAVLKEVSFQVQVLAAALGALTNTGNALDVNIKTDGVALAAGSALIGKVGVDQTTPGTTDSVSVATAQGAGATIGVTTGTKVVTDANGTLQQYLRGLVTFLANALGAGTAAAANRVVVATDDAILGALTETAPTTDTASSGHNGRLQRIAQRLTSLISPGLSAAVSVTRTADTNAYTANDVLGSATGSTAALDFNLGAISGSNIMITSVAFERDVSALVSGESSYILYVYVVTPPSALGDNAAFDIPVGDRASFVGKIPLGVLVAEGGSPHTLYIETNGINKQIKLSGTHVFGYLVTVGAYAPTSAAVHKVTLNAVQL